MKKALFFTKFGDNSVQCTLCPHNCKISDGKKGICGVRQNIRGDLYSLVYERAVAVHVDPIEKKPLFHVYPGSKSFSVATVGCNFHCGFCQNHTISQVSGSENVGIPGDRVSAAKIVEMAVRYECATIACTYTEPTVYYEYALEIARLAREKGVKTVFVTNGFINSEPLKKIAPFLAAANVDLKGWDEHFYRRVIGGKLKPVLDTLVLMKELNIWVEVTTLVVPGQVDDEETLYQIARFIKEKLGAETPWHISRFYPQYRFRDVPATELSILRRAREIGLDVGLRYVYNGNVPGDFGENTCCYACGETLILRYGFQVTQNKITNGCCPHCKTSIDGIGIS